MIKLICWMTQLRIAMRSMAEALVHDVRFYAGVWREQGLDGLLGCYRMWRASQAVSKAYEQLDAEVCMHEQQMVLLRAEMQAARRQFQTARAAVGGLYMTEEKRS